MLRHRMRYQAIVHVLVSTWKGWHEHEGYLCGTFTTKRFLFCPIFGSLQRQSRPRNFHCGACEPSGEEDDGSAGGGGPDPAVAVVRAAGEHAGSVLLDVAGAGDVLAVVAPVAGRAEALRSKFPLEDSGHFDAIVCLQSEQCFRYGFCFCLSKYGFILVLYIEK